MRGLLILRFLDDKAVSGMNEASAIAELLAAHADMERSTAALLTRGSAVVRRPFG